jgi:hypothetical protein
VESKKFGRDSIWKITEKGKAVLNEQNALEKLRIGRNSI